MENMNTHVYWTKFIAIIVGKRSSRIMNLVYVLSPRQCGGSSISLTPLPVAVSLPVGGRGTSSPSLPVRVSLSFDRTSSSWTPAPR